MAEGSNKTVDFFQPAISGYDPELQQQINVSVNQTGSIPNQCQQQQQQQQQQIPQPPAYVTIVPEDPPPPYHEVITLKITAKSQDTEHPSNTVSINGVQTV